jgi:peptide/nickel transport system permease protein
MASSSVGRRIVWAGLVVLAVTAISFVLMTQTPGDAAEVMAGPRARPATVERIRVALGLDRPVLDQLIAYYGRLLQGDLGTSYQQRRPVLDIVIQRLPATIELGFVGMALGLAIGIPLGVAAARRPGGAADRVGTVFSSVFIAFPAFVLGFAILYLFAVLPRQWGIRAFPLDAHDYRAFDPGQLALPALTLGLILAPMYVRITRSVMRDELRAPWVRTARAKGLAERRVAWRHAFRTALGPIVSQAGMDLGAVLAGVAVIEYVFGWPGLGSQALRSIADRDLPLLMGTLIVATVTVVIANLGADLLQRRLDPRIRG